MGLCILGTGWAVAASRERSWTGVAAEAWPGRDLRIFGPGAWLPSAGVLPVADSLALGLAPGVNDASTAEG